MSNVTDSVEQKCYLEYLISKYTSIQDSNPQKQTLATQYNSRNLLFTTTPTITPAEQTVIQLDI